MTFPFSTFFHRCTVISPFTTGRALYDLRSFWKRFAAVFTDGIIVTIIGAYVGMLVLAFLSGWLYYALMESSKKQATLGKMALGIVVTEMNGNRISFGCATGCYFGKILSGLILYIGYMIVGWTEKKQALHDILAGCLVVNK